MRIALIADTFSPVRTSGAVQLRDLSREFVRQGHSLTVLIPSADQEVSWQVENFDQIQVVRLKVPHIKDINYIRRAMGELIMPFAMLWQLRKSPFVNERWEGVVWYAPSIFHGPLVKALKKQVVVKGI